MCYVTNVHPETDVCKSTRPETCRNATFTWLEHARPSTKSRHIIGAQGMKGVYLFSNPTNYYNDIASAHICALMTRMCDRVLTIKPNLYTGMGYTGELGTIST